MRRLLRRLCCDAVLLLGMRLRLQQRNLLSLLRLMLLLGVRRLLRLQLLLPLLPQLRFDLLPSGLLLLCRQGCRCSGTLLRYMTWLHTPWLDLRLLLMWSRGAA